MDPFTWSLMAAGGAALNAVGEYSAGTYKAHQAEENAKIGRIKATQIDTSYREELSSTIANIRSIRASTGAGAYSPTTIAIEQSQRKISDRNRTRDVANQRIQANQDSADAKFLKKSSLFGLGSGLVGAGLKLKV